MLSTRTVEQTRRVTSSYPKTPTYLQVVSHGVAQQLRGQPRNESSVLLVLSNVRTSLRRAHEVSRVCTQTNAIPRSAASWPSTRQRCPVGSHATVTPAKLALLAWLARPVQRQPKIPRPTAERPPRKDLPIMFGHHHHLPVIGQIDPHDRLRHPHQLAKPIQSCVPIAVTPGDSAWIHHGSSS